MNSFNSKERRQKPGNKAKKHKQELAQMVEAQRQVESLGYVDTGDDAGDPDSGGYEEAADMFGKWLTLGMMLLIPSDPKCDGSYRYLCYQIFSNLYHHHQSSFNPG